jgi:hypothetical protein
MGDWVEGEYYIKRTERLVEKIHDAKRDEYHRNRGGSSRKRRRLSSSDAERDPDKSARVDGAKEIRNVEGEEHEYVGNAKERKGGEDESVENAKEIGDKGYSGDHV